MTPAARTLLAVAAALGLLSVALGAFGAHGMRATFAAASDGALRAGWWQTATTYATAHAAATAVTALVCDRTNASLAAASGWAFAAGVVVFSGTLYAMALGAPRWLGAVTPLGGLALIAGWGLLGAAALRGQG